MRLGFMIRYWAALLVISLSPHGAGQDLSTRSAEERKLDDVLGTLVVEATTPEHSGRRLIRVAIEPSLSPDPVDVLAHAVIERDLTLSGEVTLLSSSRLPEGHYTSAAPPELEVWRGTGIEALVRIQGEHGAGGVIRVDASVFLLDEPGQPSIRRAFVGSSAGTRLTSHRAADAVLGVLTGYDGGFASQLTFTVTVAHTRRAYVMDADGHGVRLVTPGHDLVSSSAFGPGHELYHAASVDHGAYRLYRGHRRAPVRVDPGGSIYGIAFDAERGRLALALAVEDSVEIFVGSVNAARLRRASRSPMALYPSFSPTGKLAYVGIGDSGHRIYVDGRPVSPAGLQASAPTFCAHPHGTRLIYALGVGKRADLVMSDELGRNLQRLTQGPGSNRYAACSPDGRLVAFFSTRKSHEGPGLYLMSIDGGRPRKISSLLGDTLRWARVPPDQTEP